MIKIFDLNTGNVVTKKEIEKAVSSAFSSFNYVRFNLHGTKSYYVMVNFNRDLTVSISTSSRNLLMRNEMMVVHRTYTKARLIDFLFKWVNKLNKSKESIL